MLIENILPSGVKATCEEKSKTTTRSDTATATDFEGGIIPLGFAFSPDDSSEKDGMRSEWSIRGKYE